MNSRILIGLLALIASPLPADPPEAPAIPRDVALVIDDAFTRPTIPPMRTSNDGRIAINLKSIGGPALFLMSPEKIQQPFLESPDGAEILASTSPWNVSTSSLHASTNSPGMHHLTLCDGTPRFPDQDSPSNPYPCASDPSLDCYDLTVVAAFIYQVNEVNRTEFWGTPITVAVSAPKTAQASLASVTTGTPVLGGDYPFKAVFEPMVTEDGRLFTLRLSNTQLTWFNPNTGQNQTTTTDIAYSVAPATANPCDVTQWNQFYPISHAPYDTDMVGRYGIAAYPFRDPQGNVVPDGAAFAPTYPWVDSQGANLFMTTLGTRLFWWDGVQAQTRHPAACVPGVTCEYPATEQQTHDVDPGGRTRGAALAGLWTHGKVVVLDSVINNVNFGLRMRDETHFMIDVFEPGTGPEGNEPGTIRVGTGRDNAVAGHPPGSVRNTTFIDSQENLFNAKANLVPLKARDVVWILDSGKTSDEVAFDDYVNPDVLILSEMTMAMKFVNGFQQYDGWTGSGFGGEMRVQNAATAPSERWIVPADGRLHGDARIEPAAVGGIRGRGLWLDGGVGIRYDVAAQPSNVATTPWHLGLFVDSRFPDDSVLRDLISFPDKSSVKLEGRHRIVLLNGTGTELGSFQLPASHILPERGWTHIGLLVEPGGGKVTLYLDGFALDRWIATGLDRILQPTQGQLYVGDDPASPAPGFSGWIDQFKLIAGRPDPEVVCNHANGTLVGIKSGATGPWVDTASSYPTWAHAAVKQRLDGAGQPSFDQYACYHDYTADNAAHRANLPDEAESVRSGLLFPEGPLIFGEPRPDSSSNAFCLSCHVPSHPPTLSLAALTADSLPMELDPRRQPMQPPRLIRGNIPADYFGNGFPAEAMTAPTGGLLQDRWTSAHPDDCNPDLDDVFAVPEEITGVQFTTRSRLSWDADPVNPATTYTVYRASIASLPLDSSDPVTCFEDLVTPQLSDAVLAPGEGFYYLVGGANNCGTSSLGPGRPTPTCGNGHSTGDQESLDELP